MNIIEKYRGMRAFHGDAAIKEKYLARLRAHAAADEIIHGTYWEKGKGCAIGCTVHSANHAAFETEIGIPAAIAHLEDALFETLPNGDSKNFPLRFLGAIRVGADLSMVIPQFLYWLFSDEAFGLIPLTKDSPADVKLAVDGIADCYRRAVAGDIPSKVDWEAAGKDVWDARAARDAWAAWAAQAAWAAWDARDARDAWAARAAWAAWDAWDARAAYRKASADKLIQLLSEAPVLEEVKR